MVTIITGDRDSGKTTKLLELHRELGQGDGFASPKRFEKGECVGYDLLRLRTGERRAFIFLASLISGDGIDYLKFGRFLFSNRCFSFIETAEEEILVSSAGPIFLDEIGPLELTGGGFAPFLRRALQGPQEVYVCVRRQLLEEIISNFKISPFQLVPVP